MRAITELEVETGLVRLKKEKIMDGKYLDGEEQIIQAHRLVLNGRKVYTQAIHYWVPSIAVSAITIYKGEEFKEWNGHALITSLKDQSLRKLIFNKSDQVIEDIIFENKIGRIRAISTHPENGKIYLLSDKALWIMEKDF